MLYTIGIALCSIGVGCAFFCMWLWIKYKAEALVRWSTIGLILALLGSVVMVLCD